MVVAGQDFYIFANDSDDALERAGSGAGGEYESPAHARREFDEDRDGGKPLFRVQVEQVRED